MEKEFISISEAVTVYKTSQNKVRKIVNDNKGTGNIKTVEIKGKHGFKYLISVAYLDALFTPVNEAETKQKQSVNEAETKLKQDNQLDNQLVIQLQETNKQLSNIVTSQQTTIKDLTNTLQEQNKIIVGQSLQIHRLSEPSMERQGPGVTKIEPGTTKFELLIITVLVVCIVIVVVYLLN